MKLNVVIIAVCCLITWGCEIKPRAVQYGQDGCHFCKMTIVDNQHAALIVTNKGKTFKYDAIECMLNDLQERNSQEIAIFQVNDYLNPGVMIDATLANFLISESIPSPMGGNLSASANQLWAREIVHEAGGELHSWTSLRQKYKIARQDNH